jgi:hypothetical protein
VLAPSLVLLAALGLRTGFASWEKTVYGAAFLAPLVARPVAETIGLPLGPMALIALFAIVVRRASFSPDAEPFRAANMSPAHIT